MSDTRSSETMSGGDSAATAAIRQTEQPPETSHEDDSARNEAKDQSSARPDLREVQVAKLREQYRQGAYEVDAAKVSAKIVDEGLAE